MKGAILVMSDSLRADHIGCYGSKGIRTPNLDRFAEESALFDRAYIASYATVPNRLDIWTGRYSFPFRGWVPLAPEDVTLPEVLAKHGITSQLIFDTPPLLGGKFYRGFSGWWQIRGHHGDRVVTDPTISTPLPAAPHKLKKVEPTRQYLRNRADWRYEKDYLAPRTFTKGMEWLERNQSLESFLLVVDTWTPHEVFDPPPHYLRLYADLDKEVENVIYPAYGHCDYMSEAELRRLRARYAGEVTMVDAWMGQLLDTVERLGLADSTLVIFTSDHGHLFGEHGLQGKPGGIMGRLYEVITRTPLIVRHPEELASGRRIGGITQPPDIMPTILDFFGIPIPETVHGRSLLPLMTGESQVLHEYAFSSRFPETMKVGGIEAQALDGWAGPAQVLGSATVTDERWALVCNPDPAKSELYDLEADPTQESNLVDEEGETASSMRQALIAFMEQVGAKREMIAPFTSEAKNLHESLAPSMMLYTIRHVSGRIFAYLTAEDAQDRLSSQMISQKVEAATFQTLLKRDPRAMIYIGDQYYWAEELSR